MKHKFTHPVSKVTAKQLENYHAFPTPSLPCLLEGSCKTPRKGGHVHEIICKDLADREKS